MNQETDLVIISLPKKRTSSDRRKIPIQKIEKKESLQVTFSKRCHGLFKKAARSPFAGPTSPSSLSLHVTSPTPSATRPSSTSSTASWTACRRHCRLFRLVAMLLMMRRSRCCRGIMDWRRRSHYNKGCILWHIFYHLATQFCITQIKRDRSQKCG